MRAEGWEALLHDYLLEAESRPFAWGEHDCALWAAGWVRLSTGDDFASAWRGRYRTARGAKALMTRRGFSGVAAIASAHLCEIPVPLAQRGDLLLHPSDSLGVCAGARGYFVTESGLLAEAALACGRAWRVG